MTDVEYSQRWIVLRNVAREVECAMILLRLVEAGYKERDVRCDTGCQGFRRLAVVLACTSAPPPFLLLAPLRMRHRNGGAVGDVSCCAGMCVAVDGDWWVDIALARLGRGRHAGDRGAPAESAHTTHLAMIEASRPDQMNDGDICVCTAVSQARCVWAGRTRCGYLCKRRDRRV